MQHIIQDWKEKKRAEFMKLCSLDIDLGGFLYPYEGIDEGKAFDWWLSQIPSLLTLLEEQIPKDLLEVAVSPERLYLKKKINQERAQFRTLLAEAKSSLT